MDEPEVSISEALISVHAASLNGQSALKQLQKTEMLSLSRAFQRFRTILKPIFSYQKIEFYESSDITLLPELPLPHNIEVVTYNGSYGIPDELHRKVEPEPGESYAALFLAKNLTGYIRASFRDMPTPELRTTVKIDAGDVYFSEIWIHPEHYHLDLIQQLIVRAAAGFLNEGFNRVILLAHEEKNGLQDFLNNAGFKKFKQLSSCKIFSKRIKISPASK